MSLLMALDNIELMDYSDIQELRESLFGYTELVNLTRYNKLGCPGVASDEQINDAFERFSRAKSKYNPKELHAVLGNTDGDIVGMIGNFIQSLHTFCDAEKNDVQHILECGNIDERYFDVSKFAHDLLPTLEKELERLKQERYNENIKREANHIVEEINTTMQRGLDTSVYIRGKYININDVDRLEKLKIVLRKVLEHFANNADIFQILTDAIADINNKHNAAVRKKTYEQPSPQPSPSVQATAKDNAALLDLMLLDNDEQKQKLLDVLHKLIDGKKGKYVALVIRSCVVHGLMSKPKFPILQKTFGDIGNVSGYRKYYNIQLHTKDEMKDIKGIETHILPFLNSI